jgi:hypothetical protein
LADEHQLLGSVLRAILAHNRLPVEVLPDGLSGLRVGISLAPYEKRVPGEFWSALDGRLKPGLQLELNLPFEVFAWQPTATPADSVNLSVGDLGVAPAPAGDEPAPPVLRRRRSGGALVMEGRPDPPVGP